MFPIGRKVQKRGGEPRLLGQREEGLEYELRGSKREDGWVFGPASLELWPEIRGTLPCSWVGLRAKGKAEAVAIYTSSDSARAQGSRQIFRRKPSSLALPGLNKRGVANTTDTFIAPGTQTPSPSSHCPILTDQKTQTPSIPRGARTTIPGRLRAG